MEIQSYLPIDTKNKINIILSQLAQERLLKKNVVIHEILSYIEEDSLQNYFNDRLANLRKTYVPTINRYGTNTVSKRKKKRQLKKERKRTGNLSLGQPSKKPDKEADPKANYTTFPYGQEGNYTKPISTRSKY